MVVVYIIIICLQFWHLFRWAQSWQTVQATQNPMTRQVVAFVLEQSLKIGDVDKCDDSTYNGVDFTLLSISQVCAETL